MGTMSDNPFSCILSFDVEEHYRIEANADRACPPTLVKTYANRMETTTYQLMEKLAEYQAQATFFIVGQIAETHPRMIRDLSDAGHEIASHGWDHQRVHRLTPNQFREDIRRSRDALEQASGQRVMGYRAPTFSVMHKTAWAVDVLVECGLTYDSSVFPVRHDRYGVPNAPRTPFYATCASGEILELPPATLRLAGFNLPVAGGGYFRLFPLGLMRAGLKQLEQRTTPPVGMLYFHPWEFDPNQPRLDLSFFERWRTYTGIPKSFPRLEQLLQGYRFRRAIDVALELKLHAENLPHFSLEFLRERTIAMESTIKGLRSDF